MQLEGVYTRRGHILRRPPKHSTRQGIWAPARLKLYCHNSGPQICSRWKLLATGESVHTDCESLPTRTPVNTRIVLTSNHRLTYRGTRLMQAFAHAVPLNLGVPNTTASVRRRGRFTCTLAPELSRRALLRNAAYLTGSTVLLPSNSAGNTLFPPDRGSPNKTASQGTTVFSVVPTSVSNVNLLPVDIDEAMEDTSRSSAVFLGEHHNSLVDHVLQARIIDELRRRGSVMVALEMVQQRFQPVLDRYIAGDIGELDLYLDTEWETRWVWPYELYLPIFRVCRQHRIPLIALSMNAETLRKLRADGGIANLSLEEFRSHIGSASVFADISRDPAFKAYISECITPSYASHYRMGLLNETANFNSFYTSRVLRDEAMASCAVRVMRQNPDSTLVCLMGSDHVKFEYGVKARVDWQLRALALEDSTGEEISLGTTVEAVAKGNRRKASILRTVMLNPGPADAYDSRDKSLKLEMAVGRNPIPIADYLWFSSPGDANPRRRAKSRLLPPVERLTSV